MTMTTASLLPRAHDGVVGEPDPAARPRRRSFTADYDALVVRALETYELERLDHPGAAGDEFLVTCSGSP